MFKLKLVLFSGVAYPVCRHTVSFSQYNFWKPTWYPPYLVGLKIPLSCRTQLYNICLFLVDIIAYSHAFNATVALPTDRNIFNTFQIGGAPLCSYHSRGMVWQHMENKWVVRLEHNKKTSCPGQPLHGTWSGKTSKADERPAWNKQDRNRCLPSPPVMPFRRKAVTPPMSLLSRAPPTILDILYLQADIAAGYVPELLPQRPRSMPRR